MDIFSVESIEEAEKVDPKEYDYICVKNVGVFYWDDSSAEPDNKGTLLRLGDSNDSR